MVSILKIKCKNNFKNIWNYENYLLSLRCINNQQILNA